MDVCSLAVCQCWEQAHTDDATLSACVFVCLCRGENKHKYQMEREKTRARKIFALYHTQSSLCVYTIRWKIPGMF